MEIVLQIYQQNSVYFPLPRLHLPWRHVWQRLQLTPYHNFMDGLSLASNRLITNFRTSFGAEVPSSTMDFLEPLMVLPIFVWVSWRCLVSCPQTNLILKTLLLSGGHVALAESRILPLYKRHVFLMGLISNCTPLESVWLLSWVSWIY